MRTHKYNNSITWYKQVQYDSKKEAEYAMYLDSEVAQGRISKVERQFKVYIRVNNQKICMYKADFMITRPDGGQEIHEVKSKATITSVFRLKWKLSQALFSDRFTFILAQ